MKVQTEVRGSGVNSNEGNEGLYLAPNLVRQYQTEQVETGALGAIADGRAGYLRAGINHCHNNDHSNYEDCTGRGEDRECKLINVYRANCWYHCNEPKCNYVLKP